MRIRQLVIAFIFVLTLGSGGFSEEENSMIAIQADRIHLGDGSLVKDGWVILRDGKIATVAAGIAPPDHAQVFSCKGEGVITPGLIDAASTAGVIATKSWTEHESEVVCHLRNLDALDLDAKGFARLAARGVTTVYVTPGPGSVIGCKGTVLKTGGPASERILLAQADVKANIGPETWRRGGYNGDPRMGRVTFMTRQPLTRMGATWVFRKALFNAIAYDLARKGPKGDRPEKDPTLEVLCRVLKGEIPLRFQAREDIDIWSTLRLRDEFGFKLILEEAIDAHRCIPELKAAGVPVIFGPIYLNPTGSRARSGERLSPCLNTAGILAEAGIPFALTAGDLTKEDALPHQACYAVRHGLPFNKALQAVTATPAEILGVSNRVGTIGQGKDGDLVLWKGKPFAATSKPALVLIGGQVVYKDDYALKTQEGVQD